MTCQEEAPGLERSYKKYKGRVNFLGLAVSDKRSDALKFIAKYRITYPNGLDPEGALSARFKITARPISIYVGPTGEILGSRINGVTEKQLESDFERLFF